jgi:hypothetical protein
MEGLDIPHNQLSTAFADPEPLSPSACRNVKGFGSPEQVASPEFGSFSFRQPNKVSCLLFLHLNTFSFRNL